MLILASNSPRRKDILASAGIPFEVQAVQVDETRLPGEAAVAYARRLAQEKAAAAAAPSRGKFILGADTIVVAGAEVLGKPASAADAARMLALLSGKVHTVITAVCLATPEGERIVEHEETQVRFAVLNNEEMSGYVASGEPMDKAGAYAIQGLASKFVLGITGDYFNVVGLPVARVYRMLSRAGAL